MTLSRLLPPSLRSGLLVAVGAALMAAPVFLDLTPAAIVTGVFTGALATALGLAGTDDYGRATLSLPAQAVYDRGLALGLVLGGLAFGLTGHGPELAFFSGAGLVTLLFSSLTRYSAARI
jgi:hypothetical protein